MKILIIGGTGLISGAITRQLLEAGHDVTLYNRGKTMVPIPPGAKVVLGDRRQYSAFESQIRAAGYFDCVIDMVCYLPEDAESDLRAFQGRTRQLIFCSTVDVYSKPASRYPIQEDELRKANNSYGTNKILCEDIFMDAHRRGFFQTTIIRPAMSYGEGRGIVDWRGWGTRVIDRLRKGKPIIVHGDGSAIWVVCHVDDVAHAFVHAIGNDQAMGKAYHVTGEEWLTWDRYYELAADALSASKPRMIHIPTDLLVRIAPEQAELCATNLQGNNIFDNTAARNDLGFRYTIPWIEGMRRVVAWLDAHGQIENSDDDPLDDQIIAAWGRLVRRMQQELQCVKGATD